MLAVLGDLRQAFHGLCISTGPQVLQTMQDADRDAFVRPEGMSWSRLKRLCRKIGDDLHEPVSGHVEARFADLWSQPCPRMSFWRLRERGDDAKDRADDARDRAEDLRDRARDAEEGAKKALELATVTTVAAGAEAGAGGDGTLTQAAVNAVSDGGATRVVSAGVTAAEEAAGEAESAVAGTGAGRAVSAICRLIGRLIGCWGRLTRAWGFKRTPTALLGSIAHRKAA